MNNGPVNKGKYVPTGETFGGQTIVGVDDVQMAGG